MPKRSKRKEATASEFKELEKVIKEFLQSEGVTSFADDGKLRKDGTYSINYLKKLSEIIKKFNLFEYSGTDGFSVRRYWVPSPRKIKSITLKVYNTIKVIFELENIFNKFVPKKVNIERLLKMTGLDKTKSIQKQVKEALDAENELNEQLHSIGFVQELKTRGDDLGNVQADPDIETQQVQDIIENHAQLMAPTADSVIEQAEAKIINEGGDIQEGMNKIVSSSSPEGSSAGLPQLDTPAIAVREQAATIDNTVNTSEALPEVAPASVSNVSTAESILLLLQERKIQIKKASEQIKEASEALKRREKLEAGRREKLQKELEEARRPVSEDALQKILANVFNQIEEIESKQQITAEDHERLSRLRGVQERTMGKLAEFNRRKDLSESSVTSSELVEPFSEGASTEEIEPTPGRLSGLLSGLARIVESEETTPEGTTPEGTTPEGTTPEGTTSEEKEDDLSDETRTALETLQLSLLSTSPSGSELSAGYFSELGGQAGIVSGGTTSSGSESVSGIVSRGIKRIKRRVTLIGEMKGEDDVKLSIEMSNISKLPGDLTTDQILAIGNGKIEELMKKSIEEQRVMFMDICEQFVEVMNDDDLFTYNKQVHAYIIALMYDDITQGAPVEYLRTLENVLGKRMLKLAFSFGQGIVDEELIDVFNKLEELPRLQEDSLVRERVAFVENAESDNLLREGIEIINNQLEVREEVKKIDNILLNNIKIILRVVSFDTLSVIRASLSANPLLLLNPVSFSFDIMGNLLNTLIRRILFFGVDIAKEQQVQIVKARLDGKADDSLINKPLVQLIINYIDTLIERPEDIPDEPPRSNVVPVELKHPEFKENELKNITDEPKPSRSINRALRAYNRHLFTLSRRTGRELAALVGGRRADFVKNLSLFIDRIIRDNELNIFNFPSRRGDIRELLILSNIPVITADNLLQRIEERLKIIDAQGWGAQIPTSSLSQVPPLRPAQREPAQREPAQREPVQQEPAQQADPVESYYELLNSKLSATIATIAGLGAGAASTAGSMISKAAGEVPIPAGLSADDVPEVIIDAALNAYAVAGVPGAVAGLGGLGALGIAGIAGLIYGGLKLGQYFTQAEIQEIGDGLKKSTTEFFKGEERRVPVEDIDKPYGDPLLRPEFMMTGTDYFDNQFSRAPLRVNNSEWAHFDYVPAFDKYNGIEMSNMFNDSIRFREPLYLPRYEPPIRPPSNQAVIATMPIMYDAIQLYQPFMDKFEGAHNPFERMNPILNNSIYGNEWYNNKLYNPDTGIF